MNISSPSHSELSVAHITSLPVRFRYLSLKRLEHEANLYPICDADAWNVFGCTFMLSIFDYIPVIYGDHVAK
jgi:hypothetical protein